MKDDGERKLALIQWLEASLIDDKYESAKSEAIDLINMKSTTWDVLLSFKEAQWKELVNSVVVGIRIYNYLHPDPPYLFPDDFISIVPPKIEFSLTNSKQRESKSSGPRAHPKEPRKISLWEDFLPNAVSFHLPETDVSLPSPTFTDYITKVSDEIALQGRIEANILNPINHLLTTLEIELSFTGHSEITKPALKGWPDHVLHEKNELRSFVETKTIWDLPTPQGAETIIEWWDHDVKAESSDYVRQNFRPSCFHIIGQVYGYLSNHALKYGMIINGEVIWFLCRPNLQSDPTMLLISSPISLIGNSPALFRAILYFISLVIEGHQSGSSPETSPANAQLPQTPTIINRENRLEIPDVPNDLDLSLLNEKIGQGFCGNVFKYIMSGGIEVALKCCDTSNNKEGLRMMKNEVKIYKRLAALQGKIIPVLRFSGFLGEVFVIGTDFIQGNCLEGDVDYLEIDNIRRTLATCQVEHGDLREKNILVDENGKYWVIDFGKSTII